MNSRVALQWQMSYFQAHLKILPTSGTVQIPNSIIPDLAQWSSACLSAPPQARSLQHLPIAIQWSAGALENSSGTGPSHQLQVASQRYPAYYGGPLARRASDAAVELHSAALLDSSCIFLPSTSQQAANALHSVGHYPDYSRSSGQ